jgi:glycosyltransferase involved in cell wall biosynthesis
LLPILKQRAVALGVSRRVRFGGHVADIGPWLTQTDVFLSTASYEGYPAVLVEAVAAGVPVVTTDCSPALTEILTDKLGRIVPADKDALADAVKAATMRGADDEPARAALIARHRVTRAAGGWLEILDRTVAERSA